MDNNLKKVLTKKSSLGIIIIAGLIWDVIISLSIFGAVYIIKITATSLHLDSNILTTNLDFISNIGIIVIFTLWFIYAIASIIKFIKFEIIPSVEVTEKEIDTNESAAKILKRTRGFCS
jgi:hypothetical protein